MELLLVVHIPLDLIIIEVVGVFGDGVVGEMGESVLNVGCRVLFGGESDVTLFVDPDSEGFQVSHNHPLPDIELN